LDDVAKRTQLNGDDGGRDNNEGLGKEEQDCSSSSSTFHGECFVFDKRVALTAGLEPSTKYISCHGCRGPMDRRLVEDVVDDDDAAAASNGKIMHMVRIRDDGDNDSNNNIEKHKKREQYEQLLMGIRNLPPLTYDTTTSKWYVPGLTCPRCHDSTTRASFERFAQRKEQMEICAREGKLHFQDNGGSSP
jgi:predicted sulfurtransferase